MSNEEGEKQVRAREASRRAFQAEGTGRGNGVVTAHGITGKYQ